MAAQTQAIAALGASVNKVETAVIKSDANNTNAIGRLTDTVNATIVRLDRQESKLESQGANLLEHSHRIKALESGSHRTLPPSVPGRGSRRSE